MHARLTALAKEDGNVRIVFKDWAIFGESSVEAARRALAAKYQGKDEAFDNALMQIQGRLSAEKIRAAADQARSEEHTSELQSLMRISYAVFCLKKKTNNHRTIQTHYRQNV